MQEILVYDTDRFYSWMQQINKYNFKVISLCWLFLFNNINDLNINLLTLQMNLMALKMYKLQTNILENLKDNLNSFCEQNRNYKYVSENKFNIGIDISFHS